MVEVQITTIYEMLQREVLVTLTTLFSVDEAYVHQWLVSKDYDNHFLKSLIGWETSLTIFLSFPQGYLK